MSEASESMDDERAPVPTSARRRRRAVAQERGTTTTSDKKAADSETGDSKAKKAPARGRKQKRPNIFKRSARFLREVVAELRKVIWPTRKMLVTYTIVVLVFVAAMIALVAGLDALFTQGIGLLLGNSSGS